MIIFEILWKIFIVPTIWIFSGIKKIITDVMKYTYGKIIVPFVAIALVMYLISLLIQKTQ